MRAGIQPGHVNIQLIAGVGFRTVKSDSFDRVRRLHGTSRLFFVLGGGYLAQTLYLLSRNTNSIENCF